MEVYRCSFFNQQQAASSSSKQQQQAAAASSSSKQQQQAAAASSSSSIIISIIIIISSSSSSSSKQQQHRLHGCLKQQVLACKAADCSEILGSPCCVGVVIAGCCFRRLCHWGMREAAEGLSSAQTTSAGKLPLQALLCLPTTTLPSKLVYALSTSFCACLISGVAGAAAMG
jgi:hypothetical protein